MQHFYIGNKKTFPCRFGEQPDFGQNSIFHPLGCLSEIRPRTGFPQTAVYMTNAGFSQLFHNNQKLRLSK